MNCKVQTKKPNQKDILNTILAKGSWRFVHLALCEKARLQAINYAKNKKESAVK